MSNDLTVWTPRQGVPVPVNATSAGEIAQFARQLTPREIKKIVHAFDTGNYEMGAFFLWSKTMAGLKNQLASLGMDFVAEMLDRPDIADLDSGAQALTDYDAVRLAEDLGLYSATQAMRLRRVLEMIAHFSEPISDEEDEGDRQMMHEEALQCLRTCIQSVLGHERLEAPLKFAEFRRTLEEQNLSEGDPHIQSLRASPYFFKRTTLRTLLALTKTAQGAQLENSLANTNVIIPLLWPDLLKADRWSIGRAYSEVYNEGRSTAAAGLRSALLKVKGFDYVPEDLRSRTFISAAIHLKNVHFAKDNFYNEPRAIKTLQTLGSVIPIPALAQCVTAVLCVRLGNYYGRSWDAQDTARSILRALGQTRWKFYLDECLPADEVVLGKLRTTEIAERWFDIVEENSLTEVDASNRQVVELIEAGATKRTKRVSLIAGKLFQELTKSDD